MKLRTTIILLVLSVALSFAGKKTKLVILHTNDTHSQVEPLEDNDMGGYARRAGLIKQIRNAEKNVLLLDAGDFSQGTPYFNFYNGRVEAKALLMMKYDAVTYGNHEFDNGMDTLATVLKDYPLPMIVANYDLKNTPLDKYTEPYKIFKRGGLKIGVFGMGVRLNGLTFDKNIAGLILKDNIETANETARYLKEVKKCDLVICLSHMGVSTRGDDANDFDVAAASTDIDVVIGGHSHEMIEDTTVENANGQPVIVAQMGGKGLNMGRIDLYFEKR